MFIYAYGYICSPWVDLALQSLASHTFFSATFHNVLMILLFSGAAAENAKQTSNDVYDEKIVLNAVKWHHLPILQDTKYCMRPFKTDCFFARSFAKFVWRWRLDATPSHAFYLTLIWSFNARKKANNHRLDKLSCKVKIIMSLKHIL